MKLLFAHDTQLVLDEETRVIYSNTFDYVLWKNRYLKHFESLTVASRVNNIKFFNPTGYQISSGDNVSFIPIPSLSNPKTRFYNKTLAKKKIGDILNDIDGVVVRLPSEIGLLTFWMAKKRNIPVAVEMVGCPADSYKFHGSLIGKLYSPFVKKAHQKALKNSDYTLYVTEGYLQKRYPSFGISTVASNVSLKVKKNNPYKEKKSKENIVLGIIGSLNVDYKGLDTAIEAISKIKKEKIFKNIKLEVVGAGSTEKWGNLIKKLNLKNNIVFKGRLDSSQVDTWLQSLDIYIHPSKTEGLPRAVIEAMSNGLPIISTDVGGIPELIDIKYLHKPNDSLDLKNKIVNLFNDSLEIQRQSIINFEKARNYSDEILTKKRDCFYQSFSNSIKNKEFNKKA